MSFDYMTLEYATKCLDSPDLDDVLEEEKQA